MFLVLSYIAVRPGQLTRRQEKKLNSFRLRCLRRILDISWQDKITNTEVLESASSFSIYTLLSQRRLRWLGHVHRMANGRTPKDMLYGELVAGTRTVGRPYLLYRDTCKRNMKVAEIDNTTWEAAADYSGHWRAVANAGMRRGEENRYVNEAVKREKRKQKSSHPAHPTQPMIYICHKCGRDCQARVGLIIVTHVLMTLPFSLLESRRSTFSPSTALHAFAPACTLRSTPLSVLPSPHSATRRYKKQSP